MPIAKLVSRWNTDPSIAENICSRNTKSPRSGKYVPFPGYLEQDIITALNAAGIESLYSHQLAAWEAVHSGANVVITTGTASGKSLCYNLPVLDYLLKHSNSRALYIFPTKALSQDQYNSLINLLDETPIDTGIQTLPSREAEKISSNYKRLPLSVYDGDTPARKRSLIRNRARILFTNPDMLHFGILPQHSLWNSFFENLSFIVIDEIHIYRGVFGSHVANVIRRLLRILDFYQSEVQFLMTSATIANPDELAEKLIGKDVNLIHEDGSPQGKKHFIIYNPPIVDQELGIRRSTYQECVRLAEDFAGSNIQTLIFGRSRRTVELIVSYLRQKMDGQIPVPGAVIRGYRSGYLAQERREIERDIRSGTALITATTNALELGIDIGTMDAVLMIGFPGTISALHQQAGRAGRVGEESIAVLLTTPDPLDQFLAANPEYILEKPIENALINPDNLLILIEHMKCAAFELPFQLGDRFGSVPQNMVADIMDYLVEINLVHQTDDRFFWMSDKYPSGSFSLRTTSADIVYLYLENSDLSFDKTTRMIGQVEKRSSLWMVHPDAVYLHEGKSFHVSELDLDTNIAWLNPVETDYYTTPKIQSEVDVENIYQQQTSTLAAHYSGEVLVREQVVGFRRIKWFTNEVLEVHELDLPATDLHTTAYWICFTDKMISSLKDSGHWSSGRIDYGAGWKRQRELARRRDGFRCQHCGTPEKDRSLDVHHKIPFKKFSSPDQANHLDNLITLCPVCHRKAETSVRIKTGLAGVGYALGNLAPLHLMCDRADLGIHTDPESKIAGSLPLVMIYEHIPAGIGLSQRVFETHEAIIDHAVKLVSECRCMNGCPSCIGPGTDSEIGGKAESLAILKLLIEGSLSRYQEG